MPARRSITPVRTPAVRRRSSSRPLPRRSLLAALLALAWVGLAAGAASAHDELVSSSPADRSAVAAAPAAVTLTFEEPPVALGAQVRIVGPSGGVADGKPVLTGDQLRQALRPGSPPGRYTVQWRVTSDDGHPVSGAFTFTVRAAATATSAPAPTPGVTPASSPSSTAGSGSGSAAGATPVAAAKSTTSSSARVLAWILGVVAVLALAGSATWAGRRMLRNSARR